MSASDQAILEAVRELAKLTSAVAMRYYSPGIAASRKSDGSPVTEADLRAEEEARKWLALHFPNDRVLGEEFGDHPGADNSTSQRRWIIDPIDGTRSFARHVPLWGTLIAVEEGGRVLGGAASFPAVSEVIYAAPGLGCWLNGARCQVSEVQELSRAAVLTTDDRFPARPDRGERWGTLAGRAELARTWGDCYGYLMVATGRAEAMVDDIASPWDVACMLPIIEEAGGVLTDFSGTRTPFGGSVIATNTRMAQVVREILLDKV